MNGQQGSISDADRQDLQDAARFLATNPLVLAEQSPDEFRLIKRHSDLLDRWFSQRFGYRLQVTFDTARLFKSSVVASRRPLYTASASKRPFSTREYTMLALALAAVVAGPTVLSLHDLIDKMRSAAVEAKVAFGLETSDRRALVNALRWMIAHGIVTEAHDRIGGYIEDSGTDAVLRVRPDRVSLLPLPILARAETAEQLRDRSELRRSQRMWMRSLLLEEPVVYRTDLDENEWTELRRRLQQETATFEEMFGLRIETRAEGLAAIHPEGKMTDSQFPGSGTVAHAALLLIDRLASSDQNLVAKSTVVAEVADLAKKYRHYWSQLADDPESLTEEVLKLLLDHRLIGIGNESVHLLPAACRYSAEVTIEQGSLI